MKTVRLYVIGHLLRITLTCRHLTALKPIQIGLCILMSLTICVHGMLIILDIQCGGGGVSGDGLVVMLFLAVAGLKVLNKEHLGISIPKTF